MNEKVTPEFRESMVSPLKGAFDAARKQAERNIGTFATPSSNDILKELRDAERGMLIDPPNAVTHNNAVMALGHAREEIERLRAFLKRTRDTLFMVAPVGVADQLKADLQKELG